MIKLSDPYLITSINVALVLLTTFGLIFYKYIFPKRRINLFFLLILISILPTISLFRPGTFQAGDLRAHTAQLIDFYYNLQQGIVLPRWGSDLCGGYGCPVFQLEYILPYYLGSFFHVLGFSILNSLKLILATAFIASGINMYIWAKDEFGEISGFVAAIFYLFAPYHLIDLYFRASIGEVLSFVFIPLLFLFAKRFIQTNNSKYFFLEAITVVCILLSHSSTTLIVIPITIGYAIVKWFQKEKRTLKELGFFIFSIIYGLLLASAYWIPALLEAKYTWWGVETYGDFKPLWEYLVSPIAYGFLFQGHQGEIRPVVGYPHILLILLGILILFQNKIIKHKALLIYFTSIFFFLFFMMLSISKPIWQNVSLLHTFIMVWRLLVPLSFVTSAVAAIVVTKIKYKWVIILLCFFTIMSTMLNWANRKMVPPLINPFVTGDAIYTEYFEPGNPIYMKRLQKGEPDIGKLIAQYPGPLEFIKGQGEFIALNKSQETQEYVLQTNTDAIIKVNTNYFPGWKVFINDKEIPINYEENLNNSFGKITFHVKKGLYKVNVLFTDTAIRAIAKNISYISFFAGILFLISIKWKNQKKIKLRGFL